MAETKQTVPLQAARRNIQLALRAPGPSRGSDAFPLVYERWLFLWLTLVEPCWEGNEPRRAVCLICRYSTRFPNCFAEYIIAVCTLQRASQVPLSSRFLYSACVFHSKHSVHHAFQVPPSGCNNPGSCLCYSPLEFCPSNGCCRLCRPNDMQREDQYVPEPSW